MINETLNTPTKLQGALVVADVFLASFPPHTPYQNFEHRYSYQFLIYGARINRVCFGREEMIFLDNSFLIIQHLANGIGPKWSSFSL